MAAMDRAIAFAAAWDGDDLADQEGFAVVYPIGVNRGWNDGRSNTVRYDAGKAPDDVAFFDALLDVLIEQAVADPSRIYVTGPSNGGMMTMRLMCDRSERIAGAAPPYRQPSCQPGACVPPYSGHSRYGHQRKE